MKIFVKRRMNTYPLRNASTHISVLRLLTPRPRYVRFSCRYLHRGQKQCANLKRNLFHDTSNDGECSAGHVSTRSTFCPADTAGAYECCTIAARPRTKSRCRSTTSAPCIRISSLHTYNLQWTTPCLALCACLIPNDQVGFSSCSAQSVVEQGIPVSPFRCQSRTQKPALAYHPRNRNSYLRR